MPQVIVEISADGNAKVEGVGVSGPACRALTAPIEKALGVVVSDQAKPEMFQTAQQQQGAKQQ